MTGWCLGDGVWFLVLEVGDFSIQFYFALLHKITRSDRGGFIRCCSSSANHGVVYLELFCSGRRVCLMDMVKDS